MTARSVIPRSALRDAMEEAKAQGVVVTITAKDGTVYQIAPMQPGNVDPFDVVEFRK